MFERDFMILRNKEYLKAKKTLPSLDEQSYYIGFRKAFGTTEPDPND